MSLSDHVHTGTWTDFSRNRFQTLQNDWWADWLKTAAGAALMLCSAYIWEIIKSTFIALADWADPKRPANDRPPDDQQSKDKIPPDADVERGGEIEPLARESDPLLSHPADRPTKVLEESTGGRDLFVKWVETSFKKDSNGPSSIGILFVVTVVLGIFVAKLVAGAFVAQIANDRAGLLDEGKCGLFEFNETRGGEEAAARADVYMYKREKRAADYAQNCYGRGGSSGPARCNFFYNASIGYQRPPPDQHCPFDDSTLCAGLGYNTGVTFDTGLKDSSVLGVNDENHYKWRRSTSCAPLDMDHGHVRKWRIRRTNETGYHYYYGKQFDYYNRSVVDTEYTLSTGGDPFSWLAPGYWVNTFGTTLERKGDLYSPIEALTPPQDSTFTIIFVTSTHIYYERPSNDLIFPATDEYQESPGSSPYYVNRNATARPLGCVDTTHLCAPSGDQCWAMNEPLPAGVPDTPAYHLMKYALARSSVYNSIKLRLGNALLAQQRIGQARSSALRDGHWEDEVEHLFASSLARAQFDAWSIASGEDREEVGYDDQLPDNLKGHLCGIYKFNTVGYVNFKISTVVWIFMSLPIAWILSWPSSLFINAYKHCLGCCTSRGKEEKPKGPKNGAGKDDNIKPRGQEAPKDGSIEISNANDNQDVVLDALGNQASSSRATDNGVGSSNGVAGRGDAPIIRSNISRANNGHIDKGKTKAKDGDDDTDAGMDESEIEENAAEKSEDDTWEPLVFHSILWIILYLIIGLWRVLGWVGSRCLRCFQDT